MTHIELREVFGQKKQCEVQRSEALVEVLQLFESFATDTSRVRFLVKEKSKEAAEYTRSSMEQQTEGMT